jgi:hypothetical protein
MNDDIKSFMILMIDGEDLSTKSTAENSSSISPFIHSPPPAFAMHLYVPTTTLAATSCLPKQQPRQTDMT